MENINYIFGLVILCLGLFLYLRRKRVKQDNTDLEFHPIDDTRGNRIEFVVRKRELN